MPKWSCGGIFIVINRERGIVTTIIFGGLLLLGLFWLIMHISVGAAKNVVKKVTTFKEGTIGHTVFQKDLDEGYKPGKRPGAFARLRRWAEEES